MRNKNNRDYQTISLFLILGLLTLAIVFILRLVLLGPTHPLLEMATKF